MVINIIMMVQYLLSNYYGPGAVLGTQETSVKRPGRVLDLASRISGSNAGYGP